MHLKRQRTPSKWPTQRKGTKFVVRPASDFKNGIPILVVLRDLLKIAQNKKEVKRALHLGEVLINQKKARDVKERVVLLDKITLTPFKQNYRVTLSDKGKFALEEIKENEAHFKLSKVTNKKIIKGKKMQINLLDGMNFISDIKCKVNDSVKVDLISRKIIECLPLQEKVRVMVFAGKHAGKTGTVSKLDREKKIVELETGKNKVNVLIKQLMVAE